MCYFTSYIIFMHVYVPRKLLFIAALSKVLSEKYFRNAENNDAELFKLSVNCQLILIRLIFFYYSGEKCYYTCLPILSRRISPCKYPLPLLEKYSLMPGIPSGTLNLAPE